MSLGLRFAVLGPVRAWRGDTELDLGAGQQRAVLAVLLLADGRQVSLAALVDALWDDPPRAATGMVRTYVSRLRRCLAARVEDVRDVIRLAGDGYLLPLGSAALDLNAFLRMTNDAHAAMSGSTAGLARGRDLLREALDLWGGLPLAGVPGPYAKLEQVRLAELQQAAIEERLAADIELGGHAAAVAELQTLMASHPMRERLSELLMLALYRAGRQADALAVFGKTGGLLREELGIDPGPGLRDIYQRILRMDENLIGAAQPHRLAAAPDASPPVPPVRPAQLPAELPAFSGRCQELALLNSLPVNASNAPRALTIVALDGMAGIGKTALAVHWAHQVAGQFPDGQLYVNLRGFDPREAMMTSGEALRSFLHALGVAPQQIPDDPESQAGLYRSLLSGRRVLILLDNARNVEQVRPLLPGSPGSLVIVTSRNALTGLMTTHNAEVLTLDQFSAGEAREALARRSGSEGLAAEPDAVAEVVDLCAGLPLAVAIVAARATAYRDRPLTEIASELRDARTRLDALSTDDAATDIRAVFSSSYQLLSPPARRLFRLASLHTRPDFSHGAAASLAGLPVTAVPPLVKELAGTRLIIEHRRGRFTFHDLIRVYAAELSAALDSEGDRHAALGLLLDYYLHTAYGAQLRLEPNCMAPPPGPARTGVKPDELHGFAEAMAWFAAERHVLQAAVSKAANTGYYAHAWQLALTLQQFFQRQGYWHDWAATMRIALDAAVDSDDLAGQAYTRRSLARACHFLGRDDEALGELERARELFMELGYSTEHAYLHSSFGAVLTSRGRFLQAIGQYRQAYYLYHAAGHPKGQAIALQGIGRCHGQQGSHQEAVRHLEKAMTIYRQLGDENGEGNCWAQLGEFHHLRGRYQQAVNCHRRSVRICRQMGIRAAEAGALASLGDSALAAGDLILARDAWDEALIILDELRLPLASSVRHRLARLNVRSAEYAACVVGTPQADPESPLVISREAFR